MDPRNTTNVDASALRFIKNYWIILAFIVSLIVQWTTINSQIVQSDKRITSLETKTDNINDSQLDIQVRLSQIQTDILWIKENIKR